MARVRDEKSYGDSRVRLLEAGMELIRSESYAGIGINDVLKASGVPKGSFYHYFQSKEAFGLEVAEFYHEQQLAGAQQILSDETHAPLERLKLFFQMAREEFKKRNYGDGCLMCNLSTELADVNDAFQEKLQRHWGALCAEITACLEKIDLAEIRMEHLSPKEVADWLLNAWSGALVRMKAERSPDPLILFERTVFRN